MNERIEKLAEQAGIWKPTHDHKTWVPGEYISSPGELEKFAELIVRECMELTHWNDFDMSLEQRIRLSVYQDIKEHFGIKE